MQTLLADVTVSMSDFKKNPAAAIRHAGNRPLAVLYRNEAAFYILEPALMEAILEELADHGLYQTVQSRMTDRLPTVEVDSEDL